jgi:hypothetical protein
MGHFFMLPMYERLEILKNDIYFTKSTDQIIYLKLFRISNSEKLNTWHRSKFHR